ncbi:carboxymuconolactone decarboxylase family protein (plasmid) [Rhodococcus opacus]|uniref:Carboxymuconolactone decarboxylase n=1 Tax=Rhodococcus opacus M213 TaxID=1129896 RepID=K8XIK2_RHOOP|nr:carboxymuconolactone decarboxylase family protein [Rhodococcus opacus]EKT81428.1 carboxymuconolactone decarboxylase [Rhodococcus opacus M213]ELB93761.1 carboxymuconolactone decarboxylase [Rhodococcus wratislaviensis IFP 2016]WKN59942.1 carboxymuconolactone decarboxylase family protein [Rhodococcus opacus]
MTRLPYLSREDATPDTAALWDRVEAERKMPTANIFRALANAPVLLDAFLSYANALRDGSELSPKLRELAILTVGHATGSRYEIAHHQSHALKAGVTPEQLSAVPDFENSGLFDETERAVMRIAEESTLKVDVTETRWAEAATHLDNTQMVELALTIAWYNSGVRIMGMLDIDLEDSYLP